MDGLKLNFSYLNMLAENDLDTKKEITDNFEKTVNTLIPKLEQEYINKDFENFGKTAHQLKPTAKMVYLSCSELLDKFQYDPSSAKAIDIEHIKTQYTQALQQIKEWSQSNK